MLRISHPNGTTESFTYNVYGQVLSHTDGKGQTTRLMRTARGLPSSRQDAKGQRVRYEYDKAIRLTALANENNATYSFTYDSSSAPIPLLPDWFRWAEPHSFVIPRHSRLSVSQARPASPVVT